jgi:hypothetical protein
MLVSKNYWNPVDQTISLVQDFRLSLVPISEFASFTSVFLICVHFAIRKVQAIKLLFMHHSIASCYFLSLMGPKHFPQHSSLDLLQCVGIIDFSCFVQWLVFYLLFRIMDKVQTPSNPEGYMSLSDPLESTLLIYVLHLWWHTKFYGRKEDSLRNDKLLYTL